MPSILSFSVKPSKFKSGDAVTLKVEVNRKGTIYFYFEGDNPPKFSDDTSKLEKAVLQRKHEFNATVSGVNGFHTIYALFTDEASGERKSRTLTVKKAE
jgi:hypothetical protein